MMKQMMKSTLAVLLISVLVLSLTACGNQGGETEQTIAATQQTTVPTETSVQDSEVREQEDTAAQIEKIGLWENAVYLADTELGQGAKVVVVEVKVEDQTVKFTLHTDATTVGAALTEQNLISGEEGQYGLYVKAVNGITADYDVNQSYWAFYIDGAYAMSGVDTTEIVEGAVYQLAYTK